MFSPAFRLALERTLNDDITPEALEGVFRVSMRKMTDAKKCRTGINLSKNLLIAKIIHKTRNIIIAAKKDQESVSSVVTNSVKVPPSCPPKVTTPDKVPLLETQPEPSSRVSPPLSTNTLNIRLRPQPTDTELQTVDENVAPVSTVVDNRICHESPRPMKRPYTPCSDKSSEHSTIWPESPPSKIACMEVDDSQSSGSVFHNPSITVAATTASSFSSVTSSTGHLHFHSHPTQSHPTMNVTTARWSFCSKDQPSSSPVTAVLYSPYHQRMSMPLTTCPI